jgi:NAD-dependent deacetylase
MSTIYRPQSIVILTGAGISAESGIKTFRASDGLWEEHRIEDVATPEGFVRDPGLVNRFYNERRQPIIEQSVGANAAHIALAKLEREFSSSLLVVTQNIDNLHEQAGSKNVLHMHGEILKMRCTQTHKIHDCSADIESESKCECCQMAGTLRPHIVWFGETPLYMDEIYAALSSCDLFIAIGTSGNVYPAAGFVQAASQAGAYCIEINLEDSQVSDYFDEHIIGKAGETVPMWVEEVLSA